MRIFNYVAYKERLWDVEIVNALTRIHEARERWRFFVSRKEATLTRLVEIAKVQSVESSNEIEGIRTTETRLRRLISEKTTPRNRDESEILGYRDALNVVHENFEYIPIAPGYIQQLHKIMLGHTGAEFAGRFKSVQNYVSSVDPSGTPFILFTPLNPFETPEAMTRLCDAYNIAIGEGVVDPLLLIPVFIHDFLCVHPFIDGNGRISRLLTTLLLYRAGYRIGKYVSLEAIVEKRKDAYYEALRRSQDGWHEGADDPAPFIKYLLGVVLAAYRELEERLELVEEKKPRTLDVVRGAVEKQIGRFTRADILSLCPTLSPATVDRALRTLRDAGEIVPHGAGRNVFYLRKDALGPDRS